MATNEQPGLEDPFDSPQPAEIQAALQAFLNAETAGEMEAVVAEFPFVAGEQFTAAAERLLEHAGASGDPEAVLRLNRRLEMLYDVTVAQSLTPAEQALDSFLYAEDEAAARQVFAQEQALLTSPEAAQALAAIEPGDPESVAFLAERRRLYAALRTEAGGAAAG